MWPKRHSASPPRSSEPQATTSRANYREESLEVADLPVVHKRAEAPRTSENTSPIRRRARHQPLPWRQPLEARVSRAGDRRPASGRPAGTFGSPPPPPEPRTLPRRHTEQAPRLTVQLPRRRRRPGAVTALEGVAEHPEIRSLVSSGGQRPGCQFLHDRGPVQARLPEGTRDERAQKESGTPRLSERPTEASGEDGEPAAGRREHHQGLLTGQPLTGADRREDSPRRPAPSPSPPPRRRRSPRAGRVAAVWRGVAGAAAASPPRRPAAAGRTPRPAASTCIRLRRAGSGRRAGGRGEPRRPARGRGASFHPRRPQKRHQLRSGELLGLAERGPQLGDLARCVRRAGSRAGGPRRERPAGARSGGRHRSAPVSFQRHRRQLLGVDLAPHERPGRRAEENPVARRSLLQTFRSPDGVPRDRQVGSGCEDLPRVHTDPGREARPSWASRLTTASRSSTAARTPRSASSSRTVGMPKTAQTASPMNFSTVPP